MRIFLNLGLSEHTGHGIPTIISKYGKEVFDISNNYIQCTIPFSKEVIDSVFEDNYVYKLKPKFTLNKNQQNIIRLLIEKSTYSTSELASNLKITQRTVQRNINKLEKLGYIKKIKNGRASNIIVIKSK